VIGCVKAGVESGENVWEKIELCTGKWKNTRFAQSFAKELH
jgi:hypothetical protein